MKKRFQTNQRILSGLAFHFAIGLLLSSAAIAQLLPNPNYGSITVNDPVSNVVPFYNWGGYITNNSYIYNYDFISNYEYNSFEGVIENLGTFNNWGEIDNTSFIVNALGGTLNNELGGYISHESEGVIENLGNFNNEGEISAHNADVFNYGTFNNELGGVFWGDFSFDNMLTGTFNNKGSFDSDGYDNYGTYNNSGYYNAWGPINNWGTINNTGSIESFSGSVNYDTINNWGTFDMEFFDNELGGYIYNEGTINILSAGVFPHVNNRGTINNQGVINNTSYTFNNQGTLMGTGTFVGELLNDSGTVAPGNSPGTMNVVGDFILDDSGILEIEIGGFTPGTFDILNITGTASMPGGNINFSFLDGYDIATDIGPLQSKELTFLNADFIDIFGSVITFDFLSIPDFQFDVFQQDNSLVFQATNLVPLPGAVLLGGIGLAVASWKLRRRKEL